MEPQGWVTLVELLAFLDVRVKDKMWGIMVPISTPNELVERLNAYTKSKLGAVFKKYVSGFLSLRSCFCFCQ